jgi:hypothetical protein
MKLAYLRLPAAVAAVIALACCCAAAGSPDTATANSRRVRCTAPPGPSPTPTTIVIGNPATSRTPVTLLSVSGVGSGNSTSLTVGSGPVTAAYSYDCSQFGPQGGNFIADMETATSGFDYQSVADDLGEVGNQTSTVYPQDPGSQNYVSIVAAGRGWSLTLTQG